MARRTRRVRMVGIWSSAAVLAALTLAGPAGTVYPGPTELTSTVSPVASADPIPPLPLPDPTKSLLERATQAKGRLDDRAHNAPDQLAAWGLDPNTGKLSVDIVGKDTAAVTAFLLLIGVDPTTVSMHTNAARVRPLSSDLVGGDAIYGGNYRCSVGANVKDRSGNLYMLTAGHCTKDAPGTWYGYNNVKIGNVVGSFFPTYDFGGVAIDKSAWNATGKVEGGPAIKGSNVAAVGASVCRSGSTSGYHCGVLQAYNQTVNYGGGDVVFGLTKTNVCAEPGDSGGTFITPSGQAQGVTSGGSGDCTVGGTTYFQPVQPILAYFGLTLVTG